MKIKKNILFHGFICLFLVVTQVFGSDCNQNIADNKMVHDANIITAVEVKVVDNCNYNSYHDDYKYSYNLLANKQDLIIAAADAIIFEANKQKERAIWKHEQDRAMQEIDAAKHAKEIAQKNKQKIQPFIELDEIAKKKQEELIRVNDKLRRQQKEEDEAFCRDNPTLCEQVFLIL